MILYKNTNGKLEQVKEKPFKVEREIQKLFEGNLSQIMGIEMVKSEFSIKNKRIDTLAFDSEANAFIIIEYKRDRNSSVVDQGMTYLNLMLQNRADFILEYNESMGKKLTRDAVEWSQSRVVFVSTDFTENQREATNFKDLAIELWKVAQFENGTITITPIRKTNYATSIKPIMQNSKEFEEVTREIKVYTEEDHLQNKSDEIVELYNKFKDAILNLSSNIDIKPQKWYVAFKKGSNFTDIYPMKSGLKIGINLKSGQLDDPKRLMRDVSDKGHQLNGDYEVNITDDKDLEYIMSLVKQAIK